MTSKKGAAVVATAEKKGEAVVMQDTSPSTAVVRKAVSRMAEEHGIALEIGSMKSIQDKDVGTCEITRMDPLQILFGLLDHGYRTLIFDLGQMAVTSDSKTDNNKPILKGNEAMSKDELKLPAKSKTTAAPKVKATKPVTKIAPEGAPKTARTANNKPKKDPVWVTQMGYNGQPEQVDKNHYSNKVVCEVCGKTRWVANADKFHVTKCKPCQRKKAGKSLETLKAFKESKKKAKDADKKNLAAVKADAKKK